VGRGLSRLDERLRRLFPDASRTSIKHWLEAGRVTVNGDVVRRGDTAVSDVDRVMLGAPPPPPFPRELRRIHEDDDILVVDKPPGLLTIATEHERERTAYRMLADWLAAQPVRGPHRPRLFVVHRIDRETSGLLVFAKHATAKNELQEQFKFRRVERVYVAVVEGNVREDEGTLTGRLREDASLRVRPARDPRDPRAKEAITRFRVIERRGDRTVLELSLETGRRGQIRAQLAALGHPIIGDVAYGSRQNPIRRVCLHATRLAFVHPRGRRVSYESLPPSVFRRV
jgi:23S rRNA pseudouridine1911/1915/1917 synthase